MISKNSTHRSDEQLESRLYETANWTVNGVQGVVLCEVASLHLAIKKAAQFAAMGREVVAIMRRRPPEIVVLAGQVRKLMNMLVEVEAPVSPVRRVAAFLGETEDGAGARLPAFMPSGAVDPEATVSAAT